MKRVFICSRYAGDVERNITIAERLCRMAVDDGAAPFAPHLLYPRIMDDDDPADRMKGILGAAWPLWPSVMKCGPTQLMAYRAAWSMRYPTPGRLASGLK